MPRVILSRKEPRPPQVTPAAVREVTPGSPADLAGVSAGWELLTVNGVYIPDILAYRRELQLGAESGGAELALRHPETDALLINLLVGSLTSGLLVIYQQWFTLCGAFDTAVTRAHWNRLVQTLLETLESGFGAR